MKRRCIICGKVYTVDLIRRHRYMKGVCPLPKLCSNCRGKLLAFGEEGKAKLTVGDLPIIPEYIPIFGFKLKVEYIRRFFAIILILIGLFTTIYLRDLFAIGKIITENHRNSISTAAPAK